MGGESPPVQITLNMVFILAVAYGAAVTLMAEPRLRGPTFSADEPTTAARPWTRAWTVQMIGIATMYSVAWASGLSRSFLTASAYLRVLTAAAASLLLVAFDGAWFVCYGILLTDGLSAVHLIFAAPQWKRAKRAPAAGPSAPGSALWRGPYWSGMLHYALVLALGMLVLFDPFVLASLWGILTSPGGPRLADVETPAGLVEDALIGRVSTVYSLTTGLFFARHTTGSFSASIASRGAMIAAAVVAVALSAAGADTDDFPWLVAPAVSVAFPSFVSLPLAVLEHSIRAGKPDPLAVRDAQAAKDG